MDSGHALSAWSASAAGRRAAMRAGMAVRTVTASIMPATTRPTQGTGTTIAGQCQRPGTLMTALFAVEEIAVAPAATGTGVMAVRVWPSPTCPRWLTPQA